jgi:hypothetical protein
MNRDLSLLTLTALTLTASLALAQTPAPATPTPTPVVPSTVDADGQVTVKSKCTGFARQRVMIDGKPQMRYVISDPGLLECLGKVNAQPSAPWTVTKVAWTAEDETNWRKFVTSIGKAVEAKKCNTVDTCLASEANPYRGDLEVSGTFYSDCADFPYYMRAYFAFKNNLPMSFGTGLTPNPATQSQLNEAYNKLVAAQAALEKAKNAASPVTTVIDKAQLDFAHAKDAYDDVKSARDTRYSRNGNFFSGRYSIPSSSGSYRDFFTSTNVIHNAVSSGSFRMLFTANSIQPDFYSTKIDRSSITSGTAVYQPTGHVALVFNITNKGIRMVDAHPDNTLTTITYSNVFVRSLPPHAAGFKNFRPFQVMNPVYDANGVITSGSISHYTDSQLPNFSLEQYFGNAPVTNTNAGQAKWVVKSNPVDYYEYVNIKMNITMNPVEKFQSDLKELCTLLQGRTEMVEVALRKKIQDLAHPENLPRNIYGAEGDWEAYSTPGRDLLIRKTVQLLASNSSQAMKKLINNDPHNLYRGTPKQLKADFIKAFNNENASCEVTYNNSANQTLTMGLGTALKRLTKMSFDPYLCAERRWGASYPAELVTCGDENVKAEWYQFQQFLRNLTEKDSTAVMGWSLSDLKDMVRRGVVDNSEKPGEYDLLKKLKEL